MKQFRHIVIILRADRMTGAVLLALSLLFSALLFSSHSALCGDELTFAVFGDSRPGRDFKQPPVFSTIIDSMKELPLDAVFHTGDVIYGKTEDPANIGRQYDSFFKIVKNLKPPIHVAAGNHDIWSEASAAIFRKQFGYLYTSVTLGENRFILLNSELPLNECRIDGEQLAWLEKELRRSQRESRNIFIILHRPMFPTNRYVGKSMDKFPDERDRLHSLFKKYGVRFVFSGHEHIYNRTEKDGIAYIVTGGGGAELYADEDKGGVHHFLLFTVKGKEIHFELRIIHKDGTIERKDP